MRHSTFARYFMISVLIAASIVMHRTCHAQGPEIGFVEDLNGSWVDMRSDGHLLSDYSAIRSDSQIKVNESKLNYFISLRIYGLDDPIRLRCDTPTICAGTIDLQPILDRRDQNRLSQFVSVISALKTIVGKRTVVRNPFLGRGTGLPRDDLVATERGQITVPSIVATLPKGPVMVGYRSATANNHFGTFTVVRTEWAGGPFLPLDLRPGLYEFHISGDIETVNPYAMTNGSMILVVPLTNYDRAVSLLQKGREYLGTLRGEQPMEESTLRLYLMMSIVSE